MTIFVMDRNYYDLKLCEEIFKKIDSKLNIKCCTSANALKKALDKEDSDIIFIENKAYCSANLIEKIEQDNCSQKIVLMLDDDTVNPAHTSENISMLVKPITEDKIKDILFKINHPYLSKIRRLQKDN